MKTSHLLWASALMVSLATPVVCAEPANAPAATATTPSTQAQPAESLQGQVSTTQAVEATPAEPTAVVAPKPGIQVSHAAEPLKGGLAKKFDAITYTLKNGQAHHMQVVYCEVVNAVEESVAANLQLQQSNTKKRVASSLLRGIGSIPIPIPGASLALYQAAAVANSVGNAAANTVSATAENQVAAVQGKYTRRISDVVLSPQDSYSFTALVPKAQAPQFKLVLKDLQTNEILTVKE